MGLMYEGATTTTYSHQREPADHSDSVVDGEHWAG
ncbi:hypothetical protein QFZ34_001542 [Phyllobacterium ifriqiyense]|uniref:Uncharacterized protein n=1 Tax=Phyllobacterium ifriqiyense TaxID=314238 RepID=A0ABU0S6I0_9HYPH|nr:hypothetical protein [Phyllobacterium ifriqiyense]